MPFCENCGSKVSEAAKFCSRCGVKTNLAGQEESNKLSGLGGKEKIKSKSPLEERQKTIVYHRSNWVRQLLVGVALIFLLFLSYEKNPTGDDFMKELEYRYQDKFKAELKQEGLMSGILGMFSSGLDFYLNSNYKRSDLLFFSIYSREVDNVPKVIAIGFWNNFFFLEEPFPSSSENIDKASRYDNTEQSLRNFIENKKKEGVFTHYILMDEISIYQDANNPKRWTIIDQGPNSIEGTAIYDPNSQTFTVTWKD